MAKRSSTRFTLSAADCFLSVLHSVQPRVSVHISFSLCSPKTYLEPTLMDDWTRRTPSEWTRLWAWPMTFMTSSHEPSKSWRYKSLAMCYTRPLLALTSTYRRWCPRSAWCTSGRWRSAASGLQPLRWLQRRCPYRPM